MFLFLTQLKIYKNIGVTNNTFITETEEIAIGTIAEHIHSNANEQYV